jgi:hypothetical protein
MGRWKSGGYRFESYVGDPHPEVHVHVYKDGEFIGRYDLEHGYWMKGYLDHKHAARALKALRKVPGLMEFFE